NTSNVAPLAPTATAATNIALTSFTANWNLIGNAMGYFIDISTNSNFSSFVTGYNNFSAGNVQTQNITGLTFNTTYYYRIRANNAVGTSPNSNVIQLTTLDNSIGPKPVPVTGFNQDIIANGSGGANRAQGSTTTDVGTFVLYSKDFRGNNNQNTTPVYGLPDNGKITNASLSTYDYQLENYTGNNALVLKNANDTGTLTLLAQDTFTNISFLAFSEGSATTINVKLNFSDGSNQVESVTISDWFGQPNFAISGIGRIGRNNDVFGPAESINDPRLYNHLINLTAPFDSKKLVSLSFTKGSTTGVSVILAVTGLEKNTIADCNINIPDSQFKNYLLANNNINTNRDNEIQCTEADSYTGEIDCSRLQIKNLNGIEAFVKLTSLKCNENQLTTIDLQQNIKLQRLECNDNLLTQLNLKDNTQLIELICSHNRIPDLDLENQELLQLLGCNNNLIESLDLSTNSSLTQVWCYSNKLNSLNLANGINADMQLIEANDNASLTCIQVDDEAYSNTNWNKNPFKFDPQHVFSEECDPCKGTADEIKSNFLVSANACIGDTIHFIDYSKINIDKVAKFEWDFGDGGTSTERDPIHTYTQQGTYAIRLIASTNVCKGLIINKSISILSCIVNNQNQFAKASIFPTPNTGNFNIEVNLAEKSPAVINVYNFGGELITQRNYPEDQRFEDKLEIANPGIYFIEIVYNKGILKRRTIVVK
ncbi:MAG TPA: PKD domain-containing protein, partial [Saprospiraceae bacterium]|nr:PKD domain-containing protein [Saprospiraceae bacterium]